LRAIGSFWGETGAKCQICRFKGHERSQFDAFLAMIWGTMGNLKCDRPWGPPADDKGEARAHMLALIFSLKYLPRDVLRDRFIYMIHGRTASFGIWIAEKDRFAVLVAGGYEPVLSCEYHWDRYGLGTAKPFIELGGPVAPGGEGEALAAKQREITYDRYVAMTRPFSDPERSVREQADAKRRLKEAMEARRTREVAKSF